MQHAPGALHLTDWAVHGDLARPDLRWSGRQVENRQRASCHLALCGRANGGVSERMAAARQVPHSALAWRDYPAEWLRVVVQMADNGSGGSEYLM